MSKIVTPVPTKRLSFPYVVNSFNHVLHLFLSGVASGDASGFNTVPRSGHAAVGISTIPAPFWTILAPLFKATDTQFGNAHLDVVVGGAWSPVWYETNAVNASSGSATMVAGVATLSGYTTSHEKTKTFLEETILTGPDRYVSYASVNANVQALLNTMFNLGGTAGDTSPWAWAEGRDGTYFSTFISAVWAYSKHWRRKRGKG